MEKTAFLYVFDTMADWETGYLTAELNSGRYFRKDAARWTVKTASPGGAAVLTMGGCRIRPDLAVEDIRIRDAGLLVLPGGETWIDSLHDPVLRRAGEFLYAGIPVAAICGATLGLGRAGFLNDRRHTSNDPDYLKAVCPNYFGEAYYDRAPAVAEGNLITATGLAPLEFAYETLKILDVFSAATLEAWFGLHSTRRPEMFHALMASLG